MSWCYVGVIVTNTVGSCGVGKCQQRSLRFSTVLTGGPDSRSLVASQPCRQGSGQMIIELIPWKFITASGWVLCVWIHRETDSAAFLIKHFRNISLSLAQAQGIQNERLCLPSKRTNHSLMIFTEIRSPTGISRAAGLSLALLPCRQAC